jgi:hypothetical protein
MNGLGIAERRAIPPERRARHTTDLGKAMKDLGYSLKQDWKRGPGRGKTFYEKNPDSDDATKPESADRPDFEETL